MLVIMMVIMIARILATTRHVTRVKKDMMTA